MEVKIIFLRHLIVLSKLYLDPKFEAPPPLNKDFFFKTLNGCGGQTKRDRSNLKTAFEFSGKNNFFLYKFFFVGPPPKILTFLTF